jgi:hypothetical protein
LRRAARLASPQHVFLNALEHGPGRVPDILRAAQFQQLLGGNRRCRLAFGALAMAKRQRGGGERAFLFGIEDLRLHGVDRSIHCLEVFHGLVVHERGGRLELEKPQ